MIDIDLHYLFKHINFYQRKFILTKQQPLLRILTIILIKSN